MKVGALLASVVFSATGCCVAYGQAQPYPQQAPYPQQQQNPYPQQQPYPQQPAYAQPPLLPPQQLDQLVGSIALYPDPLLAQVLTASTYSNDIPAAATWAVQHQYLRGPELARAIQEDNLPWDSSVIALLPFPSILDRMARDIGWTQQLGNAVLAQRPDVMDSVQRMREDALNYGYLQSNQYVRVLPEGGQIQIVPVNPNLYYVPVYDPYVVYLRPRPGFFVGGAIRFGPGIGIGAAFSPWGWGGSGFGWRDHTIVIDHRPWARTWGNRGTYVRPYEGGRPHYEGRQIERHDIRREGPRDRDREQDRDRRGDRR